MATKTLSITEDAYERLASKKGPNESFSDVIVKITSGASLMELAGVLSEKEAEDLKKSIKARRLSLRKKLIRTAKKLK